MSNLFYHKFKVDLDSLTKGEDKDDGFRLYTDGSKMENKAGYGAVLLDEGDDVLDTVQGPLGEMATVFQSESIAILEGIKVARHLDPGDGITILTDNQALVKALADFRETNLTIAETRI